MSSIECSVRVDVDIEEIIDSMSDSEKEDLYEELSEEFGYKSAIDSNNDVENYLRKMTPYELKKVLCNVLNIASYLDTEALRAKLEPIITA